MTKTDQKPAAQQRKCNAREERFAQLVAGGMSQSEAFRIANPGSREWMEKTVHAKASEMAARPRVRARIDEMLAQSAQQVVFTLADHLRNLDVISKAALKAADFNAAARAEEARGKAAGFYVQRTELTGKNGGPIETKNASDLTDDELREQLARYGLESRIPPSRH